MDLPLPLLVSVALSALTLRGMLDYARRRDADSEGRIDGAMSLGGYFFVFGACLLAVVAVFRMQALQQIEAGWPAAAAVVDRCGLIHHDSPPGEDDAEYFGATCVLKMAGGAVDWEGCCTREGRARDWLAAHPAGSALRLYREPDGKRVSLGWEGSPIVYESPQRAARESLTFAVVGCALWFGARRIQRNRAESI